MKKKTVHPAKAILYVPFENVLRSEKIGQACHVTIIDTFKTVEILFGRMIFIFREVLFPEKLEGTRLTF